MEFIIRFQWLASILEKWSLINCWDLNTRIYFILERTKSPRLYINSKSTEFYARPLRNLTPTYCYKVENLRIIICTCKWDLEEGPWTKQSAGEDSQAAGAWCHRAAWLWPPARRWARPLHSYHPPPLRRPPASPEWGISVSVTLSPSV